ncbi:hypothetical protein EAH89_24795 [Roseomonas nepalensis]|uniref:Uncharacterized protein n=1 Tax=Muricoccus nepalensis TaxID=1854500 RepID=A0A502FAR4_9PROT|nr:hypothetical protein [Roseomonas nepalensis]TPG46433.1 hypothetical protein EAH89_24795 [Roseomonas nepalensis]
MSSRDEAQATDQLRRALLRFKHAQTFYLNAHRKLKTQPPIEVEDFWDGPGRQLETALETSAKEVMKAFKLFSAAGLVASDSDRHLVTEAKRSLEQGTN